MSFPVSEADRLVAAAERSRKHEQAIRDEISTGAVRQSWMEKMFAATGLE